MSGLIDTDSLYRSVHLKLQKLWTWAVGLPGYDKSAWQALDTSVLELARRTPAAETVEVWRERVSTINIDSAVKRACDEPTLLKALSWIAIWESERAIAQALTWQKTGMRTGSHGGAWDTCFEHCFALVAEAWKKKRQAPQPESRPS
jgi:hypothetical protein